MIKLIACLAAIAVAAPANADTFSVVLGGKTLGQLSFAAQDKIATLSSTLNSTPMGVFNGTFLGTSTGTAINGRFTGISKSSRKQRSVTVEIANGRAVSTTITPQDELTELSDTTRVPPDVMDPVRIIGALVAADGCPTGMRMYDGRRVVTITPEGQSSESDTLSCNMNYRVTAGPGHLSPIGISSAKLVMRYDMGNGPQSLQQIAISSGIFRVRLNRID